MMSYTQFFKFRLPLLLLLFSIIYCEGVHSQSLKREFRGVWVATVVNIDWPSAKGLSSDAQKKEVEAILDLHKTNGMNAVILQVRPCSDALYASHLEPWSRYISGTQGQAPEPLYDPLAYWIEEAHKRGMELHAWFNPYRISMNQSEELAENHVYFKHPEWTFTYAGKTYFSPALPEVWQYVTDVVVDVVRRYDIDAVHFDDYFYPYMVAGESFPDDSLFSVYGGEFFPDRKDDWRRYNVDTIIHMLSLSIKEEKPWVKFGISPFGVWRNRAQDPNGSETTAGTTNYDALYADVIRWQREGWIDYLMPQIYWRDDHPAVDFSTLAYWWNDVAYGRSMYVGLAPYKLERKSEYKLWRKEKFFLNQVSILRSLDAIEGFAMFSSKHFFLEEYKGLNKQLHKKYTQKQALVPAMPWIDNIPPDHPSAPVLLGSMLKWDAVYAESEFDRQRFFVLYRFDADEKRFLKTAEKIVAVCGQNFYDFGEEVPSGIYRISALDRLNNESQLSDALLVQ